MADKYLGRKQGKMKAFDTEAEAMDFTEDSVALYATDGEDELVFVRIVGIKASADDCAAILQQGT